MRIVFSVHTYYPDQNGVQVVTQYLAEGLARKHDVTVITEYNEHNDDIEETYCGVRIFRINVTAPNKLYHFNGDKGKYIELLEILEPDVFVCVCTQSWQFDWLDEMMERLKCKKILFTHGFSGLRPYVDNEHHGVAKWMRVIKHNILWKSYYAKYGKLIEQFDLITHLSAANETIKYVEEKGIRKNCIIGNAVEDMFFDNPVCDKQNLFEEVRPIRYIYVSNYVELKNQKELLKAFYKTNSDKNELLFIGSSETDYYKKLIEIKKEYDVAYGNRNVIFLVGVSRKDIAMYLSESDVFVSTSLQEACSVVLLEAAAKGLAIIATNVGNAHLLPGVVTIDNYRELPYVMDEMYMSPLVRKQMGKTLRCYALMNARVDAKVKELEQKMYELLSI